MFIKFKYSFLKKWKCLKKTLELIDKDLSDFDSSEKKI